jgi:hypothetical protein
LGSRRRGTRARTATHVAPVPTSAAGWTHRRTEAAALRPRAHRDRHNSPRGGPISEPTRNAAIDSAPVMSPTRGSGQGPIWVRGRETVRRAVVNEGVISQPSHGPAPGPGVPERSPHWKQIRVSLVELVFEPAKGSLAVDSRGQPAPGTHSSARRSGPTGDTRSPHLDHRFPARQAVTARATPAWPLPGRRPGPLSQAGG